MGYLYWINLLRGQVVYPLAHMSLQAADNATGSICCVVKWSIP